MNIRKAIFISHANPEQNAFTIWLGAKLAAAGYEVWADVLRLRGGQDWQRRLEDALRNEAFKVLFVADEVSANKQGVRNELQIASDTAREIKDNNFIIPLRLKAFNAPFLIAHAQYINFEPSWATGLAELLSTLAETYQAPRRDGNMGEWLDLQLIHGKSLSRIDEELISNWLHVRRLPHLIHYSDGPQAPNTEWPTVSFGAGFLSCASFDNVKKSSLLTSEFLASGWPSLGISTEDARRRFTDIANQSLGRAFRCRELAHHETGYRQSVWWVRSTGPEGQVSFKWPGWTGRRQIQGSSSKRRIRWHFGVSASFRSVPFHHFRLKSRLIFTEDGITPLSSAARAHRLRRSFAKGWRNARWRDMLLSFLSWFGEGTTVFDVPVGPDEAIVLSLLPNTFICPVSVEGQSELADDEDDPDPETPVDDDLEDDDLLEPE